MVRINPEFQNLIPSLLKEETKKLTESILEEGVRDPLITWKGYLVDGHNRYEICKQHKISFKIKEKKFENKEEVISWII